MGIDGVRGVNFVQIGQGASNSDLNQYFTEPLYGLTGIPPGSSTQTPGYGWFYDFSQFYGDDSISSDGVILPSVEPAVFELKNPNKNVKGIVR